MKLPSNYEWLNSVELLPRTIQEALKLFGTHEIAGPGSSKEILSWSTELNSVGYRVVGYSTDDIPWCGLFAAIVAKRAGKTPVHEPLWARNWVNFGNVTKQAGLGDCLVFKRGEVSGHVAWYVGEDNECYHCLGGNQSDQVCFTRIEKSRCIAIRRPVYNSQPASVKPYQLSKTGLVSANEA